MKSGASRPINNQGRIVIPKCVRKDLNITENEIFDVGVGEDGDTIILRRRNSKEKQEIDALIASISDETIKRKLQEKLK